MTKYEPCRYQYTPHEIAANPELFVDAYTDHCGIVAIDELVRLYAKTCPDFVMDYASMRAASEGRPRPQGGAPLTWGHGGREYALSASLSSAGYEDWFYYHLKRQCWGELEGQGDERPPRLPWREEALRARLVRSHEARPVKELTLDQLARGRAQRIGSAHGVKRLVEELLKVRMRRTDTPKRRATERGIIAAHVGSLACLASTAIDVGSSRAYEDAQRLMVYTFPEGSCDFDPFRDEPDPKVLLAAEVAYRELPLWGLNGWSQSEVRRQELDALRDDDEPEPKASGVEDAYGGFVCVGGGFGEDAYAADLPF